MIKYFVKTDGSTFIVSKRRFLLWKKRIGTYFNSTDALRAIDADRVGCKYDKCGDLKNLLKVSVRK